VEKKSYKVNHIKNDELAINGKGIGEAWEKANIVSNFISPWDSEEIRKIEFKALWDAKNLYFLFKVYDSEIHIDATDNSIESIGNSDRVELFFRANEEMSPYYCLEIDPSIRLMDFMAYPQRKFDFNWSWPKEEIVLKSDIQNDYFTVEGSITMNSLKKLNLIKDNKIETGIFRAKFNKSENHNYKPTWITWVEPQSETPDFHIPSSFGILELINHLF
tara:strand:- start:54626 stop:55279 length:654 start_codon:yes stop_codon:yes gene_type:complete